MHQVRRGDTLWDIARAYGLTVEEIKAANRLKSNTIFVGQRLFIPGAERPLTVARGGSGSGSSPGRRPASAPARRPGARVGGLAWPLATVGGAILNRFGENDHDGVRWYSNGVDIAAREGEVVTAARDGRVVYAGWTGGHGNVVILEHAEGVNTVYGHLASAEVKVGEAVTRGDRLGSVGATGLAETPRLHFEVRVAGQARNPMDYLPSR
jgi:murein DD-endopeptidase MepM/ murein hydrolase activator NlpD